MEKQSSVNLSLPTADQVLRWPASREEIIAKKARAKLESRIETLQSDLSKLQERMASGDFSEESEHLAGLDSETEERIEEIRRKRETDARGNSFDRLDKLGFADGETRIVGYKRWIDLDLAGGYNERHKVLVGLQAGTYLVAHQVSCQDRNSATKFLLHPDLEQPLFTQEHGGLHGELPEISEVELETSRPTQWEFSEPYIQEATERLTTQLIVDGALSLLASAPLEEVATGSDRIDPYKVRASKTIELLPGLNVVLSATYDKEGITGAPQNELSDIALFLKQRDDTKEAYFIDVSSLEVMPGPYRSYGNFGNQHLHAKAQGLLDLAVTALAKKT